MDQYVLLHSSGWTGTPKVLILMQGPAAAHGAHQILSSLGGAHWFVTSWTRKRVARNFPWVHAGDTHTVSRNPYNDCVPVIPAVWRLRGADADHLRSHGDIQAARYSRF